MIKITRIAEIDPSDRLNLRLRVHGHLAGETANHGRNRPGSLVVSLLGEALAEEIDSLRRCRNHHYFYMLFGTGLDPEAVASETHQHAAQTQVRVDRLASRILELGGPVEAASGRNFVRESAVPVSPSDCDALIRSDLAHERRVIEVYGLILARLTEVDPWSSRLLELIREEKTRHAALLVNLLHRRRS